MPQLLAKFVPLVQTLILVGIDVRARSRFDRFTHHAHGHGGWIAAGGDVGSRFPVARSVDDGASATGVCKQVFTTSVKVVVSNTHEFHPKLKTRNRQLNRYMKLIFSESP